MKYNIKLSDGNAAASRGGANDNIEKLTVECPTDEIWAIAYLIKRLSYFDDIEDGLSDRDFKNEILDYWGVDTFDDDEKLVSVLKMSKEDFENHNFDDIDGGTPWILSIKDETGKELYDSPYWPETEEDYMDYDEAYDYLISYGADPDSAEKILDELAEVGYFEEALDQAIEELPEPLDEQVTTTCMDYDEAYDYIVAKGLAGDTAEYILDNMLDNLDEYTKDTLDQAIDDILIMPLEEGNRIKLEEVIRETLPEYKNRKVTKAEYEWLVDKLCDAYERELADNDMAPDELDVDIYGIIDICEAGSRKMESIIHRLVDLD